MKEQANGSALSVRYDLVWDHLDAAQRGDVMAIGEDYKQFLDASKTERLCVKEIVRRAEEKGFVDLASMTQLSPGDKVYSVNRGKTLMLAVIGEEPITSGMQIVGSHIDSPRIDIKQNPLYEDGCMALFKTRYYGGIRKFHWLALPLALHGVIIRDDGSSVDVNIGDKEGDPVFFITDMLPHMAAEQNKKPLGEAIEGENLNAIVGTLPAGDQGDSDRFREAILRLLHNAYQITEEDFVSAELELVPAGSARDVGFDRGAVAGYGQDDRACAYTSMAAILSAGPAAKTSVALFVDKEEIGSRGNTGMLSQYFVNTLGKMIRMQSGSCTVLDTAQALSNSAALSSDVAAAFDPNYPSISDPRNNAYLGKGVALVKYTGGRGKSNSNDAHAEFVGKVRRIMKKAGVIWQTSELGKVDQGGGGTIAYILADLDMEVMDVGVPLLAMHAPFEVVSKADVYMTVQAYKAFYQG